MSERSKEKLKKAEDYMSEEDLDEFTSDTDQLIHNILHKKYLEKLSLIYDSLNESNAVNSDSSYEGKPLDEVLERLKIDKEVVQTFTDNAKDDRKLKNAYAKWLIKIFVGQLFFFDGVFISVGLRWLNFSETTLNFFTTGAVIEVISLIAIIVRYLFQDNISKSLNSILEHNKKGK